MGLGLAGRAGLYMREILGAPKQGLCTIRNLPSLQEVDRRGVVDTARIAVTGHSYGAFMAANLLVRGAITYAPDAAQALYTLCLVHALHIKHTCIVLLLGVHACMFIVRRLISRC